jgi:predicted nucleic acid-binding protein
MANMNLKTASPPEEHTVAPQKFVSLNLTPEARDALRTATLRVSYESGRRVSLSDALIASLAVSERHGTEVTNEITNRMEAK